MKNLFSLMVFAFILTATSCKKDSDTEMLSKSLQDVIKREQVERVLYTENSITDPQNITIYGEYGKDYRFHPPFVTIEGHTFSLTSLKRYEVLTISSYKCLVLVF